MAKIEGIRTVLLSSLGICEHCQELITISDLPADAMDTDWRCPKCKGILNGESFGYEGKSKRTKWVGKDGKWTTDQPAESFYLKNWEVIPNMPPPPFFSRL
ncbi:MAG: hypothetical protein WCV58_00125 [Patescibacteria group bacterium]